MFNNSEFDITGIGDDAHGRCYTVDDSAPFDAITVNEEEMTLSHWMILTESN